MFASFIFTVQLSAMIIADLQSQSFGALESFPSQQLKVYHSHGFAARTKQIAPGVDRAMHFIFRTACKCNGGDLAHYTPMFC